MSPMLSDRIVEEKLGELGAEQLEEIERQVDAFREERWEVDIAELSRRSHQLSETFAENAVAQLTRGVRERFPSFQDGAPAYLLKHGLGYLSRAVLRAGMTADASGGQ